MIEVMAHYITTKVCKVACSNKIWTKADNECALSAFCILFMHYMHSLYILSIPPAPYNSHNNQCDHLNMIYALNIQFLE